MTSSSWYGGQRLGTLCSSAGVLYASLLHTTAGPGKKQHFEHFLIRRTLSCIILGDAWTTSACGPHLTNKSGLYMSYSDYCMKPRFLI